MSRGPGVFPVLRAVFLRNKGGAAAGILGAWFNIPLAIMMAAIGGVVGAVQGAINGTYVGEGTVSRLNTVLRFVGLPFTAEELLPTAGVQIGGIVGAIIGALRGAWTIGLRTLTWPWRILYEIDPIRPFGVAISQIVVAIAVGWLYVGGVALAEPFLLRIRGCRPMSTREAEWIMPMVFEAAARLGLRSVPRIVIDDRDEPQAGAGMRHIIINRGLIDQLDYHRTEVGAVIAHELAHWRNGDSFARAWSKGVALPLVLIYNLGERLAFETDTQKVSFDFQTKGGRFVFGLGPRRQSRRLISVGAVLLGVFRIVFFFLPLLFWAAKVTARVLVLPVQAATWRNAEYRADADAAEAGYGHALRRALILLHEDFDLVRSGWDRAILAFHPPLELRLDRLELPGAHYGLLDYHPIGRFLPTWSPDPPVEKDP
jgi:Zn-dependent protease with chaperone function